MDLPSSDNTIEIEIPSFIKHLYNLTIFVLSLLYLLCFQFPKIACCVGMVVSYLAISVIFDAVVRAFFTTPINRLPLVLSLIFMAVVLYLHGLIKEYDNFALEEALRAAELAAAEQSRFLRTEELRGAQRGSSSSSSSSEETDINNDRRGGRASLGGLDRDVWQGGERRRGWTPKKS